MRTVVSAISSPWNSSSNTTSVAFVAGSVERETTEAEMSTLPHASGPAPDMRLAPLPVPVLFQWCVMIERRSSVLAEVLDALQVLAHPVEVGAVGTAGGQVQRVHDDELRPVLGDLGGHQGHGGRTGQMGHAQADPNGQRLGVQAPVLAHGTEPA